MKQTAIEWFFWKLYILKDVEYESIMELYNQAKAMEKEQIIEAFNQSWHDRMNPYKTAEKYYNETFK